MTKSRLHLGSKTFEIISICTIKYKLNNILLKVDKNFISILKNGKPSWGLSSTHVQKPFLKVMLKLRFFFFNWRDVTMIVSFWSGNHPSSKPPLSPTRFPKTTFLQNTSSFVSFQLSLHQKHNRELKLLGHFLTSYNCRENSQSSIIPAKYSHGC